MPTLVVRCISVVRLVRVSCIYPATLEVWLPGGAIRGWVDGWMYGWMQGDIRSTYLGADSYQAAR